MRSVQRFAGLLLLSVLTALAPAGARAAIHIVNAGNFFFSPTKTQVMPGDTVRWVIVGGVHSSTSDAGSPKFWDSGVMGAGFYDVVFVPGDGPGPFPYHCSVHPLTMKDTIFWAPGVFNARMNPGSVVGSEQFDVEVAHNDAVAGEVYSTWTEVLAPGTGPTAIGYGFSFLGGAPGTWTHMLKPVPGGALTDEWHPSISANLAGGYTLASAGYAFPPYTSPNAIEMTASPGGGAGFGPPVPLMASIPGVNWVDYPKVRIDDHAGNPPPNVNTNHFAWAEFIEGGDLDADGDGNMYNDPADGYRIWYSYANPPGGPGPFPYPLFSPPVPVWTGAVMAGPGAHMMERPAVDVAGNFGTPAMPPGSVYLGWPDFGTGIIYVDAADFNSGIPFGNLIGPALGPSPVAPFIPVPQVLNGNVKAATTVAVAVDNGPNCPGNVYAAWADYVTGDADIMFSWSADGGKTWAPFIRVNSDPAGNGLDQWEPSMTVDPLSGEITIIFKDRRNDPGNWLIETWIAKSIDCGLTWRDCAISDVGPTPPMSNYATTAVWIGDYLGIDVSPVGWGYGFNHTRSGDNDVYYDTYCDPDLDGDGWGASVDCDDTDPSIYPGAPEIPDDGIDQDCNGVDATLCYPDTDGDGFGDITAPGTIELSGVCPPGWVNNNLDCDDSDAAVNPSAPEIPDDGIDQDCNGVDATLCYPDTDGDGFGDITDPGTIELSGVCPPGWVNNNLDCDDSDAAINPGAPEIPDDGIDQDCDGADATICYPDVDGDGYGDAADPGTVEASGVCPPGWVNNNLDCDDTDAMINPLTVWYLDSDGDGHGDPAVFVITCVMPAGYVLDSTDCDDTDPLVPPCGCCLVRGDVDHSGTVNVSDLTYLVAFLFSGGPPPPCGDEADVDGSGTVNVSDLTYLVAFLFSGGPPPPPC